MTITPFGDRAILLNFEQKIDVLINVQVVALSNAILIEAVEGVMFCVPAYCSITVGFNPEVVQYNTLADKIYHISQNLAENPKLSKSRRINIPVCYESKFGIDRADVMIQTNLSWKEIVDIHTSAEYRVYMLGFIAGFAYMGTLPPVLECKRKETPRIDIPSGTVGIAGLQTGVYPTRAHAGWQLIGRTPIPVFDPMAKNPFLFRVGDMVTFHAIESDTYEAVISSVESGKFDINSVISNGQNYQV